MAMKPAAGQSRAKPVYTPTARQIAAAPKMKACPYAHYDINGTRMSPAGQGKAPAAASSAPAATGGWVENASTTAPGAMSYLHAQWNVPAAPAANAGQTVYFFPGFEHAGGDTTIMQPVLGWNQSGSGISGWSGASWNCCTDGNVSHGSYIQVTGSTVSGDVSGTGCSTSAGTCSNWTIVTYDQGSEASTTYNTTSSQVMNWTFGGVLEEYGVATCSQYPGTQVTFNDFYFDDITGAHIADPAWTRSADPPTTFPACNYSIGGDDTSVALNY